MRAFRAFFTAPLTLPIDACARCPPTRAMDAASRLIDARASGGLRELQRTLGTMPRRASDRRRRRRGN